MPEASDDRTDGGGAGDEGPADRTLVHQRPYDPDGDAELTVEIVYAVAAAEGVPPVEVHSPSLYECVDVVAIEDAFFGPDVAGASRAGLGNVEFRYRDYLVRIRSDGWIQVYESG
ncbi:HalOD1 output domain-containing protein [Halomarina halobia]|uniref:HalOD1 output domain-containing protein n=1 Tax=Halomarina halobia TaxID=3033386 RepID=A0ABD6A6U8_9EURY|nr:HalOD1 output domain-containing protein [Halomarina sp. PSR21]